MTLTFNSLHSNLSLQQLQSDSDPQSCKGHMFANVFVAYSRHLEKENSMSKNEINWSMVNEVNS